MTVITYKSTDASAPVLTGQVGKLIDLLDACLVNGYSGKSAAGWSKAFSGTNAASYRMGTSGNTGFYCDINDNGPGAGGAKEARIRAYETMSALATGTGPFPTVAQAATSLFVRKSTTADATARPWYLIADSSCFYLFIDTGDYTAPAYALGAMFGDFYSYKSADAYRCALIARNGENSGATVYENIAALQVSSSNPLSSTQPGHFIARSYTTTGASIACAKHTSLLAGGNQSGLLAPGSSLSRCSYPNGPDGALELAPIWLGHDGHVRGYLKGLWCPLHNQPLGHADTFSGAGAMTGKTFLALNVKVDGSTTTNGQVVIETSDTWS